jgi:ketosteroid isomerase-like protein
MSLEDELRATGTIKREPHETPTAAWVREFYQSLDAKDKRFWDATVLNRGVYASAIFRVMKAHGFPGGQTAARDWVRKCREENESSR